MVIARIPLLSGCQLPGCARSPSQLDEKSRLRLCHITKALAPCSDSQSRGFGQPPVGGDGIIRVLTELGHLSTPSPASKGCEGLSILGIKVMGSVRLTSIAGQLQDTLA